MNTSNIALPRDWAGIHPKLLSVAAESAVPTSISVAVREILETAEKLGHVPAPAIARVRERASRELGRSAECGVFFVLLQALSPIAPYSWFDNRPGVWEMCEAAVRDRTDIVFERNRIFVEDLLYSSFCRQLSTGRPVSSLRELEGVVGSTALESASRGTGPHHAALQNALIVCRDSLPRSLVAELVARFPAMTALARSAPDRG